MKIMSLNKAMLLVAAMLMGSFAQAEPVWIDVRTTIEHAIDHIEGDVRISYGDIVEEVSELYPDKDTEIRLYCMGGGRASRAMAALNKAGYSKISSAGGIADARKERGLDQ